MQERGIVVNPGEVNGRLEDRGSIEYPKTKFRYNNTSARITVEQGKGVLILQKTGKDENNRLNIGVVEDFQSHIIREGSEGHPNIPAGYWFLLYDTGDEPLVVKIDYNRSEISVDGLEAIMPNPAFRLVRQNNVLVLLPTLRVSQIKKVNMGGIPEGKSDREQARQTLSGWHGKV